MGFHEVRFPASLSFGSLGGPERRTDIVTLANGFEERNTPWAHARRRYDAGVGLRSLDDIALLLAFFEARRGQLHGFRWKDWSDFKSGRPSEDVDFRDEVLGRGDGVTRSFALVKTYVSGDARYDRPIAKPVEGTVRLGVGDSELFAGHHFEVDVSTALVTLDQAPGPDDFVTAGFEFDVPVRFDIDRIQTSVANFQVGDVPNVPVVELRV
ncbi:MAG: phage distal tail protein, Rcc01695 family [Cognatishimia sp.]|uniref:phage distal tail protein, Rcc01695 family n=1 Tax=Cognatishimia sp. TaxID=2211648 RepID=UPI00405934A3